MQWNAAPDGLANGHNDDIVLPSLSHLGIMSVKSLLIVSLLGFAVSGCVTERVRFEARSGQMVLNRNGLPAVSSVAKSSIVLVSRRDRETNQGTRVSFVVAAYNRGTEPKNFNASDIQVVQTFKNGSEKSIGVLSYDQLRVEERNRQVAVAILVGLAAGANAAAASQAGYYRTNTTIYTPRGTLAATSVGYSPGLAAIASTNAAIQNQQMIDNAVSQGQANMARLENEYLKDHTLLPGEWYGGFFIMEAPEALSSDEVKTYSITLRIGSDVHTFNVVQEPNRG